MKSVDDGPRRRKSVDTSAADGVKRFVEKFALVMSNAGFPRMAARVFVSLLVADDGRRTAAEIADYLGISRAAVSGAVRILIQARLAAREREPGNAVDHYRVLDDVWLESTVSKSALLLECEQNLVTGAEALPEGSTARRRLEETRQFFAFAREDLSGLLERWQVRRAALRSQPAPRSPHPGRKSK